MNNARFLTLKPTILLCLLVAVGDLASQTTAFIYQGQLHDQGEPANGAYDLELVLHDTLDGLGEPVAGPITNLAVSCNDGYFTTTIDFGPGAFNGDPRWLQMAVRTNGATEFTTLEPRQRLRPTPYAITARNVAPNGILSGTNSNAMSFENPANRFSGEFSGDGSGLSNLAYESLATETQATITNVAMQAAAEATGSLTAEEIPGYGSAPHFTATSADHTNIFRGPVVLTHTNNDVSPHSLHIFQPNSGPHMLYLEGAYRSGNSGPRYLVKIGGGLPEIWSNSPLTMDGGIGSPPFHNPYMIGIFADVNACIESVNQFWSNDSYHIEAAGPSQGNNYYPNVWTVNSRGQMSLINPYGDRYRSPQLLLTDLSAPSSKTYSFYTRNGLFSLGTYDESSEEETPVIAIKEHKVGIGTTDPGATLEVQGDLFAPTNTAPFTVSQGTGMSITNGQSRSQVVLQLVFNLVDKGVPSCSIVSTSPHSTSTFVASPLPAGLRLTASITNIYTLPVQPNSILDITDTSSGDASIALLKYELFGQ